MQKWTFRAFVKPNGDDAFEDWISGLDNVDAEERIRALIKRLSNSDITSWVRPHFDILHGHKHIHEIIVKTKNRQYRPLGCFGPGPQVFTLLVGASKKEKIWSPPNAIETAEKRYRLVYKDPGGYSHEYKPREESIKKSPPEQKP